MSQIVQIRHRGLFTSPNELSAVPEGALLTADNCILTVDNIIEPRRGFSRPAALPLNSDKFSRFTWFQDQQVAKWTGGKVGYLSGSTYTVATGTFNDVDSNLARTRFLLAQNNLYFTSSTGVYRMDSYSATPKLSGVETGLDLSLALVAAGAGFLTVSNQVAYRIVWGLKDANSTLILGAPSGRAVITNPAAGGTSNVTVTFTIPSTITTSNFYQVYRSKLSGSESVPPDDELGLVYENNPTAGELITGTISFTDQTPTTLTGATIYTAPSQEGIAQANYRAPQAWDIEEFQNCVFFGNVLQKQRLTITLLSASALTVNDTLLIAGTTYTVKAAETIASGQFKKFTTGTPAQNIFDTASSLIRVINRYATNTSVYAYYLSGPDDLPGMILIEERGIGGAAFAATMSADGTAFNPVLPTSGTSVSSSSDNFINGLMYSKQGINEAVPLVNIRRIGSANTKILRIKKLRNTLFIFKEREGIYRLTGTDPTTFTVDLFDSSARLLAPDSVDVVNNQIWCLTDQGITVVTETGVSVVSRPIEDLILTQFGSALTQVKYLSFGVGYETERQYILWTVSSSGDTVASQAFVFNIFTQSYTRWPLTKSTAAVSPVDGLLYLGDGITSNLEQERKSRTYADYVDYATTYSITSSSGTQINLVSSSDISIGDVLYQSSSAFSNITDVQPGYVVVADTISWSNGNVTVLKSYQSTVEYAGVTGGNPGTEKQFPEVSMLFRAAWFSSGTVSFFTDYSPFYEDVTIAGARGGLWGLFPWGTVPWGGNTVITPVRIVTPLEKQRGSMLRLKFSMRQGYSFFKLDGWSMPARDTGSFDIAN